MGICWKLDGQVQGGWNNVGLRWGRGWGVLKMRQFSWTSYVCCPLLRQNENYRTLIGPYIDSGVYEVANIRIKHFV